MRDEAYRRGIRARAGVEELELFHAGARRPIGAGAWQLLAGGPSGIT
jgi:hypothetical protein